MSELRRVVLDNSVTMPMFFNENQPDFKITSRAKPIFAAIQTGSLIGFAPSLLMFEFVKCAWNKPLPDEIIADQIAEFRQFEIHYTDMYDLYEDTVEAIESFEVPPTDAWYVACAKQRDAELWISHRQRDGFVEAAERALPGKVFTLKESNFWQQRSR